MLERSALCHKFTPWDHLAATIFIRWLQISSREDGKKKGVETFWGVSTLHRWHGKGGWGIVCPTGERATGARASSPVTIRPNTMARGLSAWILVHPFVWIAPVHPKEEFEDGEGGMMANLDHPSTSPCSLLMKTAAAGGPGSFRDIKRGGNAMENESVSLIYSVITPVLGDNTNLALVQVYFFLSRN